MRNTRSTSTLFNAIVIAASLIATSAQAEEVSFRSQVAPIIIDNCLACHGPKKAEGGYRVDTFEQLLKPGDSGVLPVSGDAQIPHELTRRLVTDDVHERMPADSDPLKQEDIAIIQKWIEEGAKFDAENAEMPLLRVIPPKQFDPAPATYSNAIPVTALLFTKPDYTTLLSSGYHEILVWSNESGDPIRRIGNLDQRIFAMDWLDETRLVVASGEPGKSGEVRSFDFATGALLAASERYSDVVLDLAVSHDGQRIAVATTDGSVRVLNAADLKETQVFSNHADWVTSVAWSPDGNLIASASRDKTSKIVNVTNGELVTNYQTHSAVVRGVAFSDDGQHVFSVGDDKKFHRWKWEGGEKVAEVSLNAEPFKFDMAENFVFIPLTNRTVVRLDLKTNAIDITYQGQVDWVTSVATNQFATVVASGGLNGEIVIWESQNTSPGGRMFARPGHTNARP